jgi:hypothetical protein
MKALSAIRRNPLEPNKVDLFLASLRAAGHDPTPIVDIERCRPLKHSDPDSPPYAKEYNNLVDTLCRSFSKAQLRSFAKMCNLAGNRSTRKVQFAERIIENQWKWPSLKDIERQKRDTTEVSSKCV